MTRIALGLCLSLLFAGESWADAPKGNMKAAPSAAKADAVAIFAGGCFWCLESEYEKIDGVKSVVSGYTGGKTKNPTYTEIGSGKTGHAEAIKVVYDPAKVSYDKLLDHYWQESDPTDPGGQFVDRGTQYRTEIFYTTPEQKKTAEASKSALETSGRFKKPIVTVISPATVFYDAEDYHQDYYKKSPGRYNSYKENSGRKEYLQEHWQAEKPKK